MAKKVQSPPPPDKDEPSASSLLNFLGTGKVLMDLIEKRTPELTRGLMVEWGVKKLKAQGVAVTAPLAARLQRWIRAGGKGEFRAKNANGQRVVLKAQFTAAEERSIGKKLERLVTRLYESGAKTSVKTAHKALRPIYDKTWPAQSRHLKKVRLGFEQRLHGRYGVGLELYAMQLTLSYELGDSINRVVREKWPTCEMAQWVDALSRLHARACQIGYEIEALLRAGFPDGAMARWRSLHEVSVMFEFISRNGADTAVRYLAHDAIESWNAARGYNEMAKRLKHTPYTEEEMAAIKSAYDDAVATYGPEFESDYGWAAKALNIKRPRIWEIERAVGLDHFRPYYKFASHNVHANPKGVIYRLSVNGDRSLLPTGPSNVGLTEPANNAALAISRITLGFARITESLDALCVSSMLNEIPREIGNAFMRAERAILADEDKIQRSRKK